MRAEEEFERLWDEHSQWKNMHPKHWMKKGFDAGRKSGIDAANTMPRRLMTEEGRIDGFKAGLAAALQIMDHADASFPTYDETFDYAEAQIRRRMEGK